MKLKVLYLIYSNKKDSGGGHFYSLKMISQGLSEDIDFNILNIGAVYAKPLRNLSNVHYINLFKYNFFLKIFKVLRLVNKFKPDVIHAFDFSSLLVARTIRFFYPVKIVFTKCGGSNGSTFIPEADCHILFSDENFLHYQKYGNKNIPKYLIPNRVNSLKIDKIHESKFLENYNLHSKFIILRISRFNSYYDLTFRQSIELIKEIQLIKDNAVLVFIGQVQSQEYFNRLKRLSQNLPVLFVTNDVYTNEASRLINLADIVVATGRGVMEACSLNKLIFCPTQNSTLPILLNDESFDSLFQMNFSERSKNISGKNNLTELLTKKIENPNTKAYFDKHFSIHTAKTKYISIYQSKARMTINLLNYIGHALRFFKPNLID